MQTSLLLLLSIILCVHSLHILQFIPGYSSSHLLFNRRLALSLANNGHNVTLFAIIDTQVNAHSLIDQLPTSIRVHRLDFDFGDEFRNLFRIWAFSKSHSLASIGAFRTTWFGTFASICRMVCVSFVFLFAFIFR